MMINGISKNCVLRPMVFIALLLIATPGWAQTTGPEKGVLYIHGGGRVDLRELLTLIKKESGKDQPNICVITTPKGMQRAKDYREGKPFPLINYLKTERGLRNVTELFTLSSRDANLPKFYKLIDDADAVHIAGGNQSYLTEAFLGTKTYDALQRLLARGGVIAGSSAGAQVQSSFMTRGDFTERTILGDGKHQQGFGFIKQSAFDVHVEERDRQRDLFQLYQADRTQLQDPKLRPLDLLGIGIDQGTAITVRGNQFTVSGSGQVYIFDPTKWPKNPRQRSYQTLQSGRRFDLKTRQIIPAKPGEQ